MQEMPQANIDRFTLLVAIELDPARPALIVTLLQEKKDPFEK
ncbi:MAG: hypothetical protein JWM91_569 [Rhodospirillales bacterium]|nr:hypothetical protein [Rhodospirillales bacterium]